MVPVLRSPRRVDWKIQHYRWISGSYLGLLAGAATQLVVRTLRFSTKGQAWIATAVATAIVTAIGCVLIGRYRRLAAPDPTSHDLAEPA
jgi:ABC-type enterobactin transport system permease subunit